MKNAFAVIGANWGDEGKGPMTNFLSSNFKDSIVVRFNGGAQAGHTVELTDGKRHIHSHFGSGTLNGTPTYLSEYFITNPKEFFLELKELEAIGIKKPVIHANIDSIITTPYDILINREIEKSRGVNKHGSCGLGINETVERSSHWEYKITLLDSIFKSSFKETIKRIRDEWVPFRLNQLGISIDNIQDIVASDKLIEDYIDTCLRYIDYITISFPKDLLKYENIIFEGAQGLLLHEDSKFFPHVTRSKTGLENVISIAEEIGIEEITPIYMSRCYMTRHGAGEFPNELPEKPYEGIIDLTNQPNPFQDSLRFSLLDVNLLESSIKEDLEKVKDSKVKIKNPTVAITCLDQINEYTIRYIDKKEKEDLILDFLNRCKNITGNIMTSWSSKGDRIYGYDEKL